MYNPFTVYILTLFSFFTLFLLVFIPFIFFYIFYISLHLSIACYLLLLTDAFGLLML